MDYLSYMSVSLIDLESELLLKWSKQFEEHTLDQFILFLGTHSVYVEMIFSYAQKLKLSARTKYAAVFFMFKYIQESAPRSSKLQTFELYLIAFLCLQLSCKRYQSFFISVKSLKAKLLDKFSEENILKKEIEIAQTLKYDLNTTVIYDFVELYLACFWTTVQRILEVKVEELCKICELVTDLIYSQPELFSIGNCKFVASCIISVAGSIATGVQESSGALIVWLVHVSGESELQISEACKRLLSVCCRCEVQDIVDQ